jgi:hypothetical protein
LNYSIALHNVIGVFLVTLFLTIKFANILLGRRSMLALIQSQHGWP